MNLSLHPANWVNIDIEEEKREVTHKWSDADVICFSFFQCLTLLIVKRAAGSKSKSKAKSRSKSTKKRTPKTKSVNERALKRRSAKAEAPAEGVHITADTPRRVRRVANKNKKKKAAKKPRRAAKKKGTKKKRTAKKWGIDLVGDYEIIWLFPKFLNSFFFLSSLSVIS